MARALRLILVIAGKDLRLEFRSRTSLLSAAVFAALVLLVFNFARDPSAVATLDLAPSVLWVTVAFASVLAMNRAFTVERENAAFDGLLLAPVAREILYLGKYLANLTECAPFREASRDHFAIETKEALAAAAGTPAGLLPVFLTGLCKWFVALALEHQPPTSVELRFSSGRI